MSTSDFLPQLYRVKTKPPPIFRQRYCINNRKQLSETTTLWLGWCALQVFNVQILKTRDCKKKLYTYTVRYYTTPKFPPFSWTKGCIDGQQLIFANEKQYIFIMDDGYTKYIKYHCGRLQKKKKKTSSNI